MKKTIAILTVLLLLLSGCKAVKNDQTGTAATPVTDSQAEQNDQANEDVQAEMPAPETSTDVNDSEDQNSETSKETASEHADDSWKEELGWDDSWTKLEPMSYEEAHKITAEINHRSGENGLSQALTAEEKMAQYVEMKECCHSFENSFKKYGTKEWYSYFIISPNKNMTQPYEKYIENIFQILKNFNQKFEDFSLDDIQVFSHNSAAKITFITLRWKSDPNTLYSFEEIEHLLLEIYQYISSFEGVSRVVITPSTPSGSQDTD